MNSETDPTSCPDCGAQDKVIVLPNKPETWWMAFCCETEDCFHNQPEVGGRTEQEARQAWAKYVSDRLAEIKKN